MKSKKPKLLRQVTSETFEIFDQTIKNFHAEGYTAKQGMLSNVWLSEVEWKRGMNVINVYDNNTIVFASTVIK